MIKKIFFLLSMEGKKDAIFVTFVIIVQALLEVTGAAAIVPLLIVFLDSENAANNPLMKPLFEFTSSIGLTSDADFTLILISFLFGLTIFTFLMRAYSVYQSNLFVEKTRFSLSKRLLKSYLSQDYKYFLLQNASDLSKNLLSEVDQVIGKVVYPIVNMVAYAVVGFAILVFLCIANPMIAFVTFLFVGGLYGIIYLSIAKALFRMGQDRLQCNKERFIFAGEIFSGIKAIKVLGKEDHSAQKFLSPSYIFSRINAINKVFSELPAYLIEAVAVCGLIIFSYVNIVSSSSKPPEEFIPLLGLYAYSFYKLKPAVNSIFNGFSGIKYGAKTIDKLYADLCLHISKKANPGTFEKLSLKKEIKLVDVSYNYENTEKPALSSINLDIKAGSSVAIVGSTGSGKTTLTNILLDLLEPTEGQILLDGVPLNKDNARSWQKNIGYVPQDIFMLDASVAENIAFGIPKEEIDKDAVKQAAHAAQINAFIETKLEDAYDTTIGDRGIRLSGGERQRIGIARALYTNPDILVFDEATSALDSVTEKEIIREIYKLSQKKTIVMIAHRLSTVKECDLIVVLNNGEIETLGTYDDLIKKENSFSTMLNA